MLDPSQEVFRGFGSRRLRCVECKKYFSPHPRLKNRQKTCTQSACLLAYRARYRRQYRRENFQAEKDCREKIKSGRPKNFWKTYRKVHPESSARNRAQTKLRKQLGQVGLQRQLDIVQVIDTSGYFKLFQEFATSHRSLLKSCQATRAA